jgi:lipopolysaccharide transport system permease protein
MRKSLNEFLDVFLNFEFWVTLAWNDVKARYRRTILGPLWLVIATGISITCIGVVWSFVFKKDVSVYFPKLAVSMVSWMFISTMISESTHTFIFSRKIITNLPINVFLFPLKLVTRNLIAYFHNLIIVFLVFLFFQKPIGLEILYIIPGLFILIINFIMISFVVGLLSARYRDLPQVISAVMSFMIFLTPVMWDPSMLGEYANYVYLNPLASFLSIIRDPLLSMEPPRIAVLLVLCCTFVNAIVAHFFVSRYKYKIPFWV